VAEKLLEDKKLTIPCLIDDMGNPVDKLYRGWPTRIYVVRKDGRLGVAAGRGPFGLPDGIKNTEAWLKEYKETGQEPALPEAEAEPAEAETEEKQ